MRHVNTVRSLNISKVAVGCGSLDALRRRQQMRVANGVVPIYTRFRPKRAEELIGGSIYWIIKHQVTARQTILGFAESEERRTIINLDSRLVTVRAQPRRAHQGWRYLAQVDAPQDFDGSDDELGALPPELLSKLSALALI